MTFCELGLRIEDLLARHGVKPDSQLALKRAIMDVVERWDGSQTHFSLDSDSMDTMQTSEQECQTEEAPCVSTQPQEVAHGQSEQILKQLLNGTTKHRTLESLVAPSEAVHLRRQFIEHESGVSLGNLPFEQYDYKQVMNACCENVIGYMPIPVGIAGPLRLKDPSNPAGEPVYIPMATTEGALIASTNRGCRALEDGVFTLVEDDKMTRAPVLEFASIERANQFKQWMEKPDVAASIRTAFESTSKFVKLVGVDVSILGTYVHLRFSARTGDAMGMNMISKAVEAAMNAIDRSLHQFKYISISGNQCADKKASAVNWLHGRGKTVHAEAVLSAQTVRNTLKTTVDDMVELGRAKLDIGSSTGITIGGWNAHSANIVAAIFLATGQDAAQVVSSHMCLTHLKRTEQGNLHISCTLKCVEVGTVGGGTVLAAQRSSLELLNCAGAHASSPGQNACRLARVIAAAVLAGELSLLASQCAKDLVRSHLKLNRSNLSLPKIAEEGQTKRVRTEGTTTSRPLERAYKAAVPVNCSSTF